MDELQQGLMESDSPEFKPQQVWKWERTMKSKDPPTSPPATQVVKRTSALRKLTSTSLSEGRMSGMWPYGQWAREPVIRLVLLPESGNKGLLVHLSPLLDSLWSRPKEFLPQEL